jgi:hypothetical protein
MEQDGPTLARCLPWSISQCTKPFLPMERISSNYVNHASEKSAAKAQHGPLAFRFVQLMMHRLAFCGRSGTPSFSGMTSSPFVSKPAEPFGYF